MEERLVDLDELILRCRNDRAKNYIAEAVACYRAGAFRACIVTTWVAVVYDILQKLDELALAGDKNAEAKRAEFEEFRQKADIVNSLKFERQILDISKDQFEFISPIEHEDLQRLLSDRNRCAHPSMNAYDEIYQPSAELARYHLRNAVTHLLQHQPVQGKTALERLIREVNSIYFPSAPQDALAYFRQGPLLRPRDVLVRNFVIVLIKALLRTDLDESSFARYSSALNAVRTMHRLVSEKALAQNLSDTMRGIPDEGFAKIMKFLMHIPDVWQYISPDIRNRIENFIDVLDIEENTSIFVWALEFEPLQVKAQQKIDALMGGALNIYAGAQSFNHANILADKIIPLVPYFTIKDIDRLLGIVAENEEVSGSFRLIDVLKKILKKKVLPEEYTDKIIISSGKANVSILLGLTEHLTISHLETLADAEISAGSFKYLLDELKKENKLPEEQYTALIARRGIEQETDEDLPF
jgi:hypothetical protein